MHILQHATSVGQDCVSTREQPKVEKWNANKHCDVLTSEEAEETSEREKHPSVCKLILQVESKEEKAERCFDEIGLKKSRKTYDDYQKCMSEEKGLRALAIACKAMEKGVTYGTAEGPVQQCMLKTLFLRDGTKKLDYGYSNDRMTNFAYTLRIVMKILEKSEAKKEEMLSLAWNSYGGTSRPLRKELFENGYKMIKNILDKPPDGYQTALEDFKCLQKMLNEFAWKSSTLGNYCLIPETIPFLGIRRLNGMKGGVGASLFVHDDCGNEYRVNDQFALFVKWIDEQKETIWSYTPCIIKNWKDAMLLNDVWNDYQKAAKEYFRAFNQDDYTDRVKAFVRYLQLVNIAITKRSISVFERCTEECKKKRAEESKEKYSVN